ncbi:MAG: hypothetical protein ACXWH0_04985 [Acidimicrobiia bacterium]
MAEFLLDRRLFWRRGDGRLLEQFIPIWFPIRFYDPLFALQVMVEISKIDDPVAATHTTCWKAKSSGTLASGRKSRTPAP